MTEYRPEDKTNAGADHLREPEERLRLAMDVADMRSWTIDVASGAVTWTDSGEHTGEVSRPDTVDEALEMVHPDARTEVKQTVEQVIDNGGEFEIDYPLAETAADGTTWLSSAGTAIADGDGSIEYIVGVTQDITERKQREATPSATAADHPAETDHATEADEHETLAPPDDGVHTQQEPTTDPLSFLSGGGEMGTLIREKDWSETPLGPIEEWSRSLRTAVSVGVASNFPINIIWGDENTQIYNDGYRPLCGDLHPDSMGQDYTECWASAWDALSDPFERASAGESAFLENQRMFLERDGYTEETFFTFSLSPIFDETGDVGGLFHPVIELTQQTLSQRRLKVLRDLAGQTADANTVDGACTQVMQTLADYELDLPFALLYRVEADGTAARLVEHTGIAPGTSASPEQVALTASEQSDGWPFAASASSGRNELVDDLDQRFVSLSCGPYPEPPEQAFVLPITAPGMEHPLAFLVAGVSSRRALDEPYRDFYTMLRNAVANMLVTAHTYEEERKRREELAELDRAKTTFFNNVSHEFRTPLTLMLGPLEDALAEADTLPPEQRERIETAHNNSQRLLKLVNSLLDFSRIEAGHMEASYEPTQLAEVTADLASNFRSAIERAGLELHVNTPPLSESVYVDREMWEKIVLNLLSNAFKHTFEGEITVSLRTTDSQAELEIRDTGTGIPEDELPDLFDRFHQVEGARSRTHEGSGIGLALVNDLIEYHDGDIAVESTVGEGSTFTVTIPLGTAHLPDEQIETERSLASTAVGAEPYVEEALRWLSDADDTSTDQTDDAVPDVAPRQVGLSAPGARVLVVDDNADMREYLKRLLGRQWDVNAVPDGETALSAAHDWEPDIVLADVMMPGLDGFELLEALRDDPSTREIPIILLSARAGEEARVEGLEAGADDYLVKPFSARELVARVGSTLELEQVRKETEAEVRESEERLRLATNAGEIGVWELDLQTNESPSRSPRHDAILGYEESRDDWSVETFLEHTHPDDRERVKQRFEEAFQTGEWAFESRIIRADDEQRWIKARGEFYDDDEGEPVRAIGTIQDITERKQREQRLARQREQIGALKDSLLDISPTGILLVDEAGEITFANDRATDILGRSREDLVGRALNAPEFSIVVPNGESIPDERLSFEQVKETDEPVFGLEVGATRADGQRVWLSVNAAPLSNESDEPTETVVALEDITDRKQLTEALERLNDTSRELMDVDWETITDRAAAIARDVLDVEYTALWHYDADAGDLQRHTSSTASGTASDDIRYPDGFAERAWQAFISNDSEVDNDLPPDADITPAESPLRSCVIVPLGRHGVICAGITQPHVFDTTTVDLAETVAANIEAAFDRADREQQLEAQNTELTQLDRINTIIREIDQGLVQAETREEIDRIVCERLAESDRYEFAWIGEFEPETDTVTPREWAGVDPDYLDGLEITTDETQTGQGPVGTALRTCEPQMVEDIVTDARFVPWREQTLAQDVRSCISVPLTYEDSLYGVLTVYAAQPIDDTGYEVLAELGEMIGHAINAVETKRTLQTDSVVELGLQFQEPETVLWRLATQAECTIEFEGLVPHADDPPVVFFMAHNVSLGELQTAADGLMAIETLTCLSENADEGLFKVRIDGSTLASAFIAEEAVIRSLTIEETTVSAVVDLAQAGDVRPFVERIQAQFPSTDLVARRTRDRSLASEQNIQTAFADRLTDRQQEVLRTAYLSGFFEMPRESTGQEIADILDVSQPTFTQHLRRGQHTLFELLFDEG